jgi:hypothetical protein
MQNLDKSTSSRGIVARRDRWAGNGAKELTDIVLEKGRRWVRPCSGTPALRAIGTGDSAGELG